MARPFRPCHYDAILTHAFCVEELLPAPHPAYQLVALLAALDLTPLYRLYLPVGGHPYEPRMMLALWLYGYMTGVTSARKLERATYEQIPFLFLAAGAHPDHTALAEFRTLVFAYLPTLFDDLLAYAQQAGVVTLRDVSHDGTKIHADASKHQAVSYQRAGELIHELQTQIDDLLRRAQEAPASLPAELDLAEEITRRRARITRLQAARQVLEARADERYQADLAAYEAKRAARAERARVTGKKPPGKPPAPPTPGPAPTEQYNFTDPDSRIMKNSTNTGVDQHYNCQATVEHDSRLIVGCALSNHPTDTQEALPSLDAIPAALGTPDAACLDAGFWSPQTVEALEQRGITPYIAVGKGVHGLDWQRYYGTTPTTPPPPDASPSVHMAYRLQTPAGQALYRQRKSTIEPVFGSIKEVQGFRQFSLRGLTKAAGEWRLVCLAYNVKRFFALQAEAAAQQARALAQTPPQAWNPAVTACVLCLNGLASLLRPLYGLTLRLVSFNKASLRLLATGC
jgi:transposase